MRKYIYIKLIDKFANEQQFLNVTVDGVNQTYNATGHNFTFVRTKDFHQVEVVYNNVTLFNASVNETLNVSLQNCVQLKVDNCANDTLDLTVFGTQMQLQCSEN